MEQHLMQGMILLRAISAGIEVIAVMVMLRLADVESVLRLNASLGLVGPVIFALVSALGLVGLSGKVPIGRFILIAAGILLVLLGTRRS